MRFTRVRGVPVAGEASYDTSLPSMEDPASSDLSLLRTKYLNLGRLDLESLKPVLDTQSTQGEDVLRCRGMLRTVRLPR